MTLSADLWAANQNLALTILHHPFVKGLADGSLTHKRFEYYVGQDAFFLQAFAKAYTIAGAKSPDWEGFCTLHALAEGVLQELTLHEKYAALWGVDLIQTKPSPATRRYTDFVMATAWSRDIGITLAALCPCMRLYAYLGQQLAKKQPPNHRYIDWIRTYASQDIENLAQKLEHLTDTYARDDLLVRETYRYAMACEHDFFQAAYDCTTP